MAHFSDPPASVVPLGALEPDRLDLEGIDVKGAWALEMEPKWERAENLLGGTDTMRAAGLKYLPQYEAEDDFSYGNRLDRAVLTNFYKTMLESMVGRVFQKPIVVQSSLPPSILNNIDRQGNSLSRFARDAFRTMLRYGYCHVLCNYPKTAPGTTLAEERARDIRPYWQSINPDNMIDIYVENVDGAERILQARWIESESVIDGFKRAIVQKLKVLEPGFFSTYQYDADKKSWFRVEEESGTYSLDYVPLRTIYTHKEGHLLCEPPLDGVAHLNIEHWQSASDQRNILTLSRFAMLAQSGGNEPANLSSGPRTHLYMGDASGKFYFVEPKGEGIQSGERDLHRILSDAHLVGFDLMTKRKGNPETASGRTIDAAKVTSPLQDMALSLEDGINDLMLMTADWLRRGEDYAGFVKVNEDYSFMPDEQARLDTLFKARTSNQITQETYLTALQQMGVFSADINIEDEVAATSEDDGGLGLTFAPAAPPPTEEEEQVDGDDDEQSGAS